jgi:hypothetical protein
MYDPKVGRWLSQDPLGFTAGDANLYRYVGNGPTNGTDASGLILGDPNSLPPGPPPGVIGPPPSDSSGWNGDDSTTRRVYLHWTPPPPPPPTGWWGDFVVFMAGLGHSIGVNPDPITPDDFAHRRQHPEEQPVGGFPGQSTIVGLWRVFNPPSIRPPGQENPTDDELAVFTIMAFGGNFAPGRGVGGRGWRGDATWRGAVRQVARGGTVTDVSGQVPTQQEGIDLITAARGTVDRIEGPHPAPNPHQYPHINYTTADGTKGTIRIK